MFEVIGGNVYEVDSEEVEGDVMGDVMGEGSYDGGGASSIVLGYDDEGEPVVVGAQRRVRRRIVSPGRGGHLVKVRKPGWRASQLAPGVIAPDQGLITLPMQGIPGQSFSATVNQITFQGQLQKPFRGERLLVSTVRTGTSAVGRLLGVIYVGTDPQQADITALDIEQIGSPAAFGVRLAMKPAQPGVLIRIVVSPSSACTSTDTIFCSVQLLGRVVH